VLALEISGYIVQTALRSFGRLLEMVGVVAFRGGWKWLHFKVFSGMTMIRVRLDIVQDLKDVPERS
jgi:hypothetical protein